MKLPKSIPLPFFVGVVAFFALLYGSYVAGSSNAPSSEPVYITDGTGGNQAEVVNVNRQGHLSVHIADSGLPAFSGQVYARHISYPVRGGLVSGQCYAAFVRGSGQFVGAAVRFLGGGAGRPQVLVRIDPNPVWVETGGPDSTPAGPNTGFARSGSTDEFGYASPLSFKSFVGVMLCWHGSGQSDKFAVQMTLANGGFNPYDPEELTFLRTGDTFTWTKLQGPVPAGYQIWGTDSTIVTYYQRLAATVPQELPRLHGVAKPIVFTRHVYHFRETASPSHVVYPRYYLFEIQPSGDPTRVGPFGSFKGE